MLLTPGCWGRKDWSFRGWWGLLCRASCPVDFAGPLRTWTCCCCPDLALEQTNITFVLEKRKKFSRNYSWILSLLDWLKIIYLELKWREISNSFEVVRNFDNFFLFFLDELFNFFFIRKRCRSDDTHTHVPNKTLLSNASQNYTFTPLIFTTRRPFTFSLERPRFPFVDRSRTTRPPRNYANYLTEIPTCNLK